MKIVQQTVKEIPKRTERYNMDQMAGFVHLSAGVCLYKAEFGVHIFEAAAQHFNSAVKMGWTQGYYYPGMLYRKGLGVEPCDITAKNFFQQGTDAGVPAAMSEPGQCYDEGIGVEYHPAKAVELVRRSVARKDRKGYAFYACYNLHGHSVAVNTSRGFKMAKKASESNLVLGSLGQSYAYGIGVERDPSEAFKLLNKHVEVLKIGMRSCSWQNCMKKAAVSRPVSRKWLTFIKEAASFSRGNGLTIKVTTAYV